MITDIRVIPFTYAPGTVLNSVQEQTVHVGELYKTLDAGAKITIPEHLAKVLVVSYLGPNRLEHTLLRFGDHDPTLIPISVKIYTVYDASVLIFRPGVEAALNRLSQHEGVVNFTAHEIWSLAANAGYTDPYVAESLRDFFDIPTLGNDLYNDTCYISTAVQPRSATYPWNLGDFNSPYGRVWADGVINLNAELRRLSDFNIRIWTSDRDSFYPLYSELKERFTPAVPVEYRDIAWDSLTRYCLAEPEFNSRNLFQHSGIYRPQGTQIYQVPATTGYEEVTTFSSQLLQLCVWIHQLPWVEGSFNYRYPGPGVTERLEIVPALSKNQQQLWCADLNSLLRGWSPTLQEVQVIKTYTDELFLCLRSARCEWRYHLDLGMTTLLTQGLVRTTYESDGSKE